MERLTEYVSEGLNEEFDHIAANTIYAVYKLGTASVAETAEWINTNTTLLVDEPSTHYMMLCLSRRGFLAHTFKNSTDAYKLEPRHKTYIDILGIAREEPEETYHQEADLSQSGIITVEKNNQKWCVVS